MIYHIDSRILGMLLFVCIVLCYFLGLSVLRYRIKRNPAHEPSGIGAFESALLGLIALLLAFTFNMSASHFDTRRAVLINETNAIGTALLRCDLYPDSIREALRADFKSYITSRIDYYEAGRDEVKIKQSLQQAGAISGRIWSRTALIS